MFEHNKLYNKIQNSYHYEEQIFYIMLDNWLYARE